MGEALLRWVIGGDRAAPARVETNYGEEGKVGA